MRIAVISDIHGNLTALEAVIADLRDSAPDAVLCGGDIADTGARPAEVIDLIRSQGWGGVLGNTDEMLVRPSSLHEFSSRTPGMGGVVGAVDEMAAATRQLIGPERIAWLGTLPVRLDLGPVALIHASPASVWRAPSPGTPDEDLESTFRPLGQPVVVFGHIHRPFVKSLAGMTVVNAGSVGLPYDGDTRAAYVLIDDESPEIRRVPYDVEREVAARRISRVPHGAWVAELLRTARPLLP